MRNLKNLTLQIEARHPITQRLKKRVFDAFHHEQAMERIWDEICANEQKTECGLCDDEGVCLLLSGIANLYLERLPKALDEIQRANGWFRRNQDAVNSIVGLDILGMAEEMDGRRHQALLEYQQAWHLLQNQTRLHANENFDKLSVLRTDLQERLTHPISHPPKEAAPPTSVQPGLLLAWIPVYGAVQAGTHGPIWYDHLPADEAPVVNEVFLEGQPFQIQSLTPSEHLIRLTQSEKYGWVKVAGDSMSAAKPVPLLAGDYVLFHHNPQVENRAIVIAGLLDEASLGQRLVIKRYYRDDQLLISETDPPDQYPFIAIDERVRLFGTALAVAKPVQARPS